MLSKKLDFVDYCFDRSIDYVEYNKEYVVVLFNSYHRLSVSELNRVRKLIM